ncbi:MAG: hypothetical protein C0618_08960 [Desulfuromonas sp.]|nr:MAG: hypothetical protein C0618_08960 [Desulfuromonas sp.]
MVNHIENEPFEIRSFVADNESQLMTAWEEAYPALFHFKFPDRWRWNMFNNPFVPADERPLCWVAVAKNGEIAAWSTAMAVPVIAAGQHLIGAHSCDTYTLERYRRYGLGKKLQQLNQDAHGIFIAIDPSPPNRRNKYKVGGQPGKPLDTWLRIGTTLDKNVLYESFLKVVEKYLGRFGEALFFKCRDLGPAWLLNAACSLSLRLRQRRDKKDMANGPGDLKFEEIAHFGEETDLLWCRLVDNYSFAVERNSAYLNWKYVRQPNFDYHKVLALRNGEPVGLLVYRLSVSAEQRVGIISECFSIGDNPAIHASLIALAMAEFDRNGIDLIKCGASTENQRETLKRLGFGLVDIDVPVFHISPQASGLNVDEIMARDWLLSLGDSDLDQIRPVQQPSFVEIVRVLKGKIPGSEYLP